MAAQAAITLNSVVYAPGGANNGIAKWTNRSGGFGASFANVTEQMVTPPKSTVTRIVFDLDLPIVATEDDTCACAGTLLRTSTVKISVWVPNSSTAAERADLLHRISDLVASTPFVNAVDNLDPSY
jgi:hypothetical protein